VLADKVDRFEIIKRMLAKDHCKFNTRDVSRGLWQQVYYWW